MTDNEALERATEILQMMVALSETLLEMTEATLTDLITVYLATELQDVYSKGFSDGYGDGKSE